MSYYKIRSMKVRGNEVYVTAAASNVTPQTWFESTLLSHRSESVYKQLVEVGRALYSGDFQFLKSTKGKAKRAYDACRSKHGDWRSHHDDPNAKKYRERFASEFARRMIA